MLKHEGKRWWQLTNCYDCVWLTRTCIFLNGRTSFYQECISLCYKSDKKSLVQTWKPNTPCEIFVSLRSAVILTEKKNSTSCQVFTHCITPEQICPETKWITLWHNNRLTEPNRLQSLVAKWPILEEKKKNNYGENKNLFFKNPTIEGTNTVFVALKIYFHAQANVTPTGVTNLHSCVI